MSKFQPGQSGNPGGRPKAVNRVRELIDANGEGLIEGLVAIANSETEDAKDRIAATRELLDRWLGKAPQTFEDGDGGKVVVQVVRFGADDPAP